MRHPLSGWRRDSTRELVLELVDLAHTCGPESPEVLGFLERHKQDQVFCERIPRVLRVLRGEEEKPHG